MARSRYEAPQSPEKSDAHKAYALLGVDRLATTKEIRTAFQAFSKQYHPDSNGGDKTNEEKLKEISGAYNLLKDPIKRAILHMAESNGLSYERQSKKPGIREQAVRLATAEERQREERFRLREQEEEAKKPKEPPPATKAESPAVARRRAAAEKQAEADAAYARRMAEQTAKAAGLGGAGAAQGEPEVVITPGEIGAADAAAERERLREILARFEKGVHPQQPMNEADKDYFKEVFDQEAPAEPMTAEREEEIVEEMDDIANGKGAPPGGSPPPEEPPTGSGATPPEQPDEEARLKQLRAEIAELNSQVQQSRTGNPFKRDVGPEVLAKENEIHAIEEAIIDRNNGMNFTEEVIDKDIEEQERHEEWKMRSGGSAAIDTGEVHGPPSPTRVARERLRDIGKLFDTDLSEDDRRLALAEQARLREELAKTAAKNVGLGDAREAMHTAEQKAEEGEREFYRQSLAHRAAARFDGNKAIADKRRDADVSSTNIAYQSALENRVEDKLGAGRAANRKTLTPEQANKIKDRYRRTIIRPETTLTRAADALERAKSEELTAKESSKLSKGFAYLIDRNAALERKLGPRWARVVRAGAVGTLGAAVALGLTASGVVAVPALATLGVGGFIAERSARSLLGGVLGAAAARSAGDAYEKRGGTKRRAARTAATQGTATSAEELTAMRKAYQAGSEREIAKSRRWLMALAALAAGGATSAGVSLAEGFAGLGAPVASVAKDPDIMRVPPVTQFGPDSNIQVEADLMSVPPVTSFGPSVAGVEVAPTPKASIPATSSDFEALGPDHPIKSFVSPEGVETTPAAPTALPGAEPGHAYPVEAFGLGTHGDAVHEPDIPLQPPPPEIADAPPAFVVPSPEATTPTPQPNAPVAPRAEVPAAPKAPSAVVEVRPGLGYESMIRDLVAKAKASGEVPAKFPPNSDAARLLSASGDTAHFNRQILQIEKTHKFITVDAQDKIIGSATVKPGTTLTFDEKGKLVPGQGEGVAPEPPPKPQAAPRAARPPVPERAPSPADSAANNLNAKEVARGMQGPDPKATPRGPDYVRGQPAPGARLATPQPEVGTPGRAAAGINRLGATPGVASADTVLAADASTSPAAQLSWAERTEPFKTTRGLSIDPKKADVYTADVNGIRMAMSYGHTYAERFAVAEAFARTHKGIPVLVEAESTYTGADGAQHPWVFSIKYRGLFRGGIETTKPMVVDAAHPPPINQIGSIDPNQFIGRAEETPPGRVVLA